MKINKWIKFLGGICGLALAFVLLPKIHSYIPGSHKLQQTIEKENIEVNALFYSEESRSSGSKKAIEEKLQETDQSEKTKLLH